MSKVSGLLLARHDNRSNVLRELRSSAIPAGLYGLWSSRGRMHIHQPVVVGLQAREKFLD